MEFTGTVKAIMPVRTGVSKNTGREWRSQDILVAFDHERWTESYLFSAFNKELKVNIGDVVTVQFDGEAREYNGRYFNSLNLFSIKLAQTAQPSSLQAAAQPRQSQQEELPF